MLLSSCAKDSSSRSSFLGTNSGSSPFAGSSSGSKNLDDLISDFDSRIDFGKTLEPQIVREEISDTEILVLATVFMNAGQKSIFEIPDQYSCDAGGSWSSQGLLTITQVVGSPCSISISVPGGASLQDETELGAVSFRGQSTDEKDLKLDLVVGLMGYQMDFDSPAMQIALDDIDVDEVDVSDHELSFPAVKLSEKLALGEISITQSVGKQGLVHALLLPDVPMPVSWNYSFPEIQEGFEYESEYKVQCHLLQNVISFGEPDVEYELPLAPQPDEAAHCPILAEISGDAEEGSVQLVLQASPLMDSSRYQLDGLQSMNLLEGAKNSVLFEVTVYSKSVDPNLPARTAHVMRFPLTLNVLKQPKIETDRFKSLGEREGVKYYLAEAPMTFGQAVETVNDLNEDLLTAGYEARLVEFNSKQEWMWSKQYLNRSYWMGITDEAREGRWTYMSNAQLVSFTHWYEGEPNNRNGENCAVTYWGNNPEGLWNDVACYYTPEYRSQTALFGGGFSPLLDVTGAYYVVDAANLFGSSGANAGTKHAVLIEVSIAENVTGGEIPPTLVIR